VRWWDIFVTNAGVVAVVDAIVAGALAGLVVSQAGMDIGVGTIVGLIAGGAVLAALIAYLARSWRRAAQVIGVRFPGDEIDTAHIPAATEPDVASR
jgi:hypothetical protein